MPGSLRDRLSNQLVRSLGSHGVCEVLVNELVSVVEDIVHYLSKSPPDISSSGKIMLGFLDG